MLRELQLTGLNVVYSSDLVRPEMTVAAEPGPGSPRDVLKRLLAPFGLKVEDGPINTLLVVYDSSPRHSKANGRYVVEARSSSAFIVVPFVNINVIAQDQDNEYVTTLTAEDFIVKEDGKLRYIVDFQNYSDTKSGPGFADHTLS